MQSFGILWQCSCSKVESAILSILGGFIKLFIIGILKEENSKLYTALANSQIFFSLFMFYRKHLLIKQVIFCDDWIKRILKKLEPEGQAEATNSDHSKAKREHICLQNRLYLCWLKQMQFMRSFPRLKKRRLSIWCREKSANTSWGGFHLHLLMFPFIYQFNFRIGVLVHSSFASH